MKQKVLISCEISINTIIHGSYFYLFSHSKILGCDTYVLCKDTDGNVLARYVGPRDGYAYRWYSIWVPKSLVANARGPISQWAPKPKN
jgi:hypothetical protein